MWAVIGREWRKNSAYRPAFPKPWVASITGLCDRYGFQREFRWHYCDYTHATKMGSRGIMFYFPLPPGLYEESYQQSWKHHYRGFFRVDPFGEIQNISKDEVLQCLKNAD